MIVIDEDNGILKVIKGGREVRSHGLGTAEAFAEISRVWLTAGFYTKHVCSLTWLERPVIQLPEDLVRIQEVIYRIRPEVIIETGIAHGGSLVFDAGLLKLLRRGRVVEVYIEIGS